MRNRAQLATLAIVAVAVVAIVVVTIPQQSSKGGPSTSVATSSQLSSPTGFDGAALPGDPAAPNFTLTDQQGRRVSLRDPLGQVKVLTFLYSTCGATCVLIAQQIRGALDELAHPVQVLIVSADPAADTPAHIRSFLEEVSLSGRVEYLTGSEAQLRMVWRDYHVVPASAGRREFDPHATVLLIDGVGRERVLFEREQLTPESLSHDIAKLQRTSRAAEGLIP
jgi:protein SCO1/2